MRSFKLGIFNLFIFFILNVGKVYVASGAPPIDDISSSDIIASNENSNSNKTIVINVELRDHHVPDPEQPVLGFRGILIKIKDFFVYAFNPQFGKMIRNEVSYDKFGFLEEERSILNYPNKLKRIKIANSLILKFDEKAQLPSYRIVYLIIYRCKHYYPVLIDLYGLFEHTYYSQSKKTGLWNNKPLKVLNKLKGLRKIKNVDENRVEHYVVMNRDQTEEWNKGFYNRWSSLVKKFCGDHKNEIKGDQKSFELTVELVQPRPQPKPVPVLEKKEEQKTEDVVQQEAKPEEQVDECEDSEEDDPS